MTDDDLSHPDAAELARLPPAARRVVTRLGMRKIPHEGPWFVETHRSGETLEGRIVERYPGPRVASTAILALMARESFSALHRLATDELWHFHDGDPLELLLLHPDRSSEEVVLGRDLDAGQHPQYRVPAGTWMGATPAGADAAWSLIGNTLAPGFEYADYEAGDRDALRARHPERAARIERLTRGDDPADAAATGASAANVAEVPEPALAFEELMGRTSTPSSSALSIARFSLEAGAATPASYNRTATEAIVVLAGRAVIVIGEDTLDAGPGSVTALPPGVPHAIRAVTGLAFLAITTPAFGPDEFVAVT